MIKIVYHDMVILFHGNNIHHNIIIFALNKVLMKSKNVYHKSIVRLFTSVKKKLKLTEDK